MNKSLVIVAIIVLVIAVVVSVGAVLVTLRTLPGALGANGAPRVAFRLVPIISGVSLTCFLMLVLGGLVLLIIGLARGNSGFASTTPVAQTPLDALKTRYAKGEITKEQYEEMRRDLEV